MQALETEIGGQRLDRGHTGVALTAAGYALLEGMRPVVARADMVMSEVRKRTLAALRAAHARSTPITRAAPPLFSGQNPPRSRPCFSSSAQPVRERTP